MIFVASDSNVAMQVRQPWMKFGTDAEAFDPATAKIATHPRAYGTYPRILGRFVRDEHMLTLEDAVRKMTSARRRAAVDSRSRTRCARGCYADVMIFDPNDDHRSGDVRGAAPTLGGDEVGARERRSDRRDGRSPARNRGGSCVDPGGSGTGSRELQAL